MPLLAKYHIEVHAVHIFLDEYHYERELAILTELAQKYHISWFVVKSPARLTKDVLDETAARYRELAEELEKAGAGLLIHNEKEDICIRVNGKTAYEYLLEACGEKVGAEVDAGWMYCGGVDPEEFLWAHADRVKAVHYKDMKITGQEAPLGKGMVGSESLLPVRPCKRCTADCGYGCGNTGGYLPRRKNALRMDRGQRQHRQHSLHDGCGDRRRNRAA